MASLTDLPVEMIPSIASYLDIHSLTSLASTNSQMREIIRNNQPLWKGLIERDFIEKEWRTTIKKYLSTGMTMRKLYRLLYYRHRYVYRSPYYSLLRAYMQDNNLSVTDIRPIPCQYSMWHTHLQVIKMEGKDFNQINDVYEFFDKTNIRWKWVCHESHLTLYDEGCYSDSKHWIPQLISLHDIGPNGRKYMLPYPDITTIT